jgi:hypothetical protein
MGLWRRSKRYYGEKKKIIGKSILKLFEFFFDSNRSHEEKKQGFRRKLGPFLVLLPMVLNSSSIASYVFVKFSQMEN